MSNATAATWDDLRKRCEAATGPSRSIDVSIENAAGAAVFYQPNPGPSFDMLRGRISPLTGSIDAIVSLIGKTMPGASFKVGVATDHADSDNPLGWWAELHPGDSFYVDASKDGFIVECQPNAALALCAAYCAAMAAIAERTENEGAK